MKISKTLTILAAGGMAMAPIAVSAADMQPVRDAAPVAGEQELGGEGIGPAIIVALIAAAGMAALLLTDDDDDLTPISA